MTRTSDDLVRTRRPQPASPHKIRLWRPPAAWRERTDWVPLDTTLGQLLRGARWAAVLVWLGVLSYNWTTYGIPFDRTGLLLWIGIGLACFSIGRHPVWLLWVVIDFLPLAAVLIVYDRLRGLSDTVGMPTWWHPQVAVDKLLFAGHEPTVWLQEHLKRSYRDPVHHRWLGLQWYDVAVCICYYTFFFLPYLLAGILWLRSRVDFYRWIGRFVGLSFLGFVIFMLIPAAPPWAAARCTSAQVGDHPSEPSCMWTGHPANGGGLLGTFTPHHSHTAPYVELITTRGFAKLHLNVAASLVEHGRGYIDNVAAVPSLHVGGTVLFVLFMWRRVNRWWRVLLAAYPLLMQFTLTYGGDHYVADGIAGALCAWFVHWAAGRVERWHRSRRTLDTLDTPSHEPLEFECPPTDMTPNLGLPPGRMPSST